MLEYKVYLDPLVGRPRVWIRDGHLLEDPVLRIQYDDMKLNHPFYLRKFSLLFFFGLKNDILKLNLYFPCKSSKK